MSTGLERLRAQILADRQSLAVQIAELAEVENCVDPGQTARAAWALHHGYSAVEAMLERVARAIEGGAPTGPEWHRELLDAAALELGGLRPAILSRPTVGHLHHLRAFRHFARHGYGSAFDPVLVQQCAAHLHDCAAELAADLDRFDAFLAEVIRRASTTSNSA